MECNRDEAIRAKTIAEEKLDKKEFTGAKKFAQKAQSLYPQLDGLSQLLTTIDVYVASENRVGSEVDWYGILGVTPTADDETIKKQYRKLALMLHPDKNKSAGADGAFKLLCEAWILLSDKSKRLEYNRRRFSKGFHHNVSVHTSGPSATSQANGLHSHTSRTSSAPKTSHSNNRMPAAPTHRPVYQRTDTFWTICHRCKMHYEYLKIYLNHTLLCPNCHDAFLASETAPPFNSSRSTTSSSSSRQRGYNSNNSAPASNSGRSSATASKDSRPGPTGQHSFANSNFQQDSLSRTAGVGSVDPSIAAKAANVIQQAHEKVKRERDSSHFAAGWDGNFGYSSASVGERPYKKTHLGADGYSHGVNVTHNWQTGTGATTSASGRSAFEADRMRGFTGNYSRPLPNSVRELAPVEVRNMLMEKGRKQVRQKLDEWKSKASNKTVDVEKVKESRNGKGRSTAKSQGCDPSGTIMSCGSRGAKRAEKLDDSTDAGDAETTVATMNVPDPDFHDFDLDRTERSFEENEVWAAYDDNDGMPRFYAMINKVISRKPFKVRLNFLNSKTTSEFGEMEWVGLGFYKTCGEFRHGRHEMSKSINSFSHKVKWSKGLRGVVHILPRKGDVWALYQNWSRDWNESTPDEVIHKYEMVVVLGDYSEDQGVQVAPLIKVVGFKTVFLPDVDSGKLKTIPREEMFRFSHQVPYHELAGDEAPNIPKGSLELDPAATPVELLQVLREANDGRIPEHGAVKDDNEIKGDTDEAGRKEKETVSGA